MPVVESREGRPLPSLRYRLDPIQRYPACLALVGWVTHLLRGPRVTAGVTLTLLPMGALGFPSRVGH